MGNDKAVEKYDYIRRVDAICDLITGVLATGAQTPEELGEHLPGLLQMVPEYHASLVPKVYPDLVEALLKPKNRKHRYVYPCLEGVHDRPHQPHG